MSEGRDRQAVQDILWLLETVSTAFQGIDTGAGNDTRQILQQNCRGPPPAPQLQNSRSGARMGDHITRLSVIADGRRNPPRRRPQSRHRDPAQIGTFSRNQNVYPRMESMRCPLNTRPSRLEDKCCHRGARHFRAATPFCHGLQKRHNPHLLVLWRRLLLSSDLMTRLQRIESALARSSATPLLAERVRRLKTIPGVGPITALTGHRRWRIYLDSGRSGKPSATAGFAVTKKAPPTRLRVHRYPNSGTSIFSAC